MKLRSHLESRSSFQDQPAIRSQDSESSNVTNRNQVPRKRGRQTTINMNLFLMLFISYQLCMPWILGVWSKFAHQSAGIHYPSRARSITMLAIFALK